MRIPASKLIGSSVHNDRGEDLGTINDLLIDLDNGEIRYAVLSFGGLLGFRNKYIAVPLPLLQVSKDSGKCMLNESKVQLRQSPGFNKNEWPGYANSSQVDIVQRYNKVRFR
ncbi:MAG: PRC-barrel domain-containing protein [Woeseiaceae bacterium]